MLASAAGAFCRTAADNFLRLVFQFVRRDDAIDESDFTCALGTDQVTGEEQLANIALAQLPPEEGHDQAGNESALCLRVADLRPLRRDDEITGRHQSCAAGYGRAVNLRDRDQTRLADREQGLRHHFRGAMRFFDHGGFLQIKSGTECLARPAQDKYPLLWIGAGLVERVRQLAHQFDR